MFAIVSAVLFGTMPLFTKTAYAYGCNAYTVAFGRFLVGALGSGMWQFIFRFPFQHLRNEKNSL